MTAVCHHTRAGQLNSIQIMERGVKFNFNQQVSRRDSLTEGIKTYISLYKIRKQSAVCGSVSAKVCVVSFLCKCTIRDTERIKYYYSRNREQLLPWG